MPESIIGSESSYHFINQLKAAENAYRSGPPLQPDNAEVLQQHLGAMFYSQRKFSDAERQVRRAMEKNPENAIMRAEPARRALRSRERKERAGCGEQQLRRQVRR